MYSYNDAFYHLKKELLQLYDAEEAVAIAHEVLEHLTGYNKLQRIAEKGKLLTGEQMSRFESVTARLLKGEPLQYITGLQWFMGKPFKVNPNVLIPRPETEELVQWIITDWNGKAGISILDVGTGSGCIPVSLKMQLPGSKVTAVDISEGALEVAAENAVSCNVQIELLRLDFLSVEEWELLGSYDVIVSNPPYIPFSEKEKLDKNVRDYEPGTALFVPADDALLFYKKLGEFAKTHLAKGGAMYCEVHKDHALQTQELFNAMNYSNVHLRKDMHGNDRMIKVLR